MTILGVIVAVVAAFLVFRFVAGIIKFVLLGLILLLALYLLGGSLAG